MEKAIKKSGGRVSTNQAQQPLKSKREILINVRPYEKRIAILEDGRLAEIVYERPDSNRLGAWVNRNPFSILISPNSHCKRNLSQ